MIDEIWITDEIRKQLVEWGGVAGDNWVRFPVSNSVSWLQFYQDGMVLFVDGQLAPWKTLEDIENVLDVFGVKRKKWRASNHCVYIGGKFVAAFYLPGRSTTDPEAAKEYAEWMNSKE